MKCAVISIKGLNETKKMPRLKGWIEVSVSAANGALVSWVDDRSSMRLDSGGNRDLFLECALGLGDTHSWWPGRESLIC